MRRAARTNLILLGLAGLLGVAVYSQVRHEIAQFEPPLTALDPATVDRIAVGCAQCTQRRFERVKGRWSMREPYAMAADDAAVDRLLSVAASPVRARHARDAFDPRKVGLDPPLMHLRLGALDIDIGTSDALRGDRYVRIGETIAMVPDRFSPFLAAAPESELDRHLVPRDVELVELRIDGQSHPELKRAWSEAVAARIERVEAPPSAPEARRVELVLGNDETVRYRLVRGEPAFVALREAPALAYVLSEEQVRTLLHGADAKPD